MATGTSPVLRRRHIRGGQESGAPNQRPADTQARHPKTPTKAPPTAQSQGLWPAGWSSCWLISKLPACGLHRQHSTEGHRQRLKKGYGKDAFVCAILSVFWATAARQSWRPIFTRVSARRMWQTPYPGRTSPGPSTRAGNASMPTRSRSWTSSPRQPPTPSSRPRTLRTNFFACVSRRPLNSLTPGAERGKGAGRAESARSVRRRQFCGRTAGPCA